METVSTLHSLTYSLHPTPTMLVLPNMDPAHRTHGPPSLPRAVLRHATSIAARLSILISKAIGMALVMFLVPRAMHALVLCLDALYEVLGRRAASPWELQAFYGFGVFGGLVVMVVMHCLLVRVAYCVILNDDQESSDREEKTRRQRAVTWEKVLMRIVIPMFLCGGLCMLAWSLWKLSGKRELVRANTVDLADDAVAGLVWRDR
jgi:H+/Cl- antiporter ClcA